MISNRAVTLITAGLMTFTAVPAFAHFGMMIPSENIVTQEKKNVEIKASFSHPFELVGMELEKPAKFSVFTEGQETDLSGSLTKISVMDHTGWQTNFKVKKPGVYQFVMEPKPYWEPAEDVSIIHYTKNNSGRFR